jgi:hypothetical protein
VISSNAMDLAFPFSDITCIARRNQNRIQITPTIRYTQNQLAGKGTHVRVKVAMDLAQRPIAIGGGGRGRIRENRGAGDHGARRVE